jgi:hypothetical protein
MSAQDVAIVQRTLRLWASWGAHRLELAAGRAPAIVVALVAAVAISVAAWLRWLR